MLPLDFAVDGLLNDSITNEESSDQEHTATVVGQQEVLAVVHQQPESTGERTDGNNNFNACIEILLSSTYYGRACSLGTTK